MAGAKRHSRDALRFYRFTLNTAIEQLGSSARHRKIVEKLSRVADYLRYQDESRKQNAKLGGRPTPDELEGWKEAVETLWRRKVPEGTVPPERRCKLQGGIYAELSSLMGPRRRLPHQETVFRYLRTLNGESKNATKP